MKIKVIIPDRARDRDTLNSREKMLIRAVSSDVEIVVDNIKIGPDNLDSNTDEAFAAADMVRQCIKAEQEGCDAAVIYCFSDVGMDAARENVSIPVIGAGETSLAVANMLFSKFTVITTQSTNISRTYRRLLKNNIAREKMTSVKALDISLTDLRQHPDITEQRLLNICSEAMKEEKIDGVILGCLGMASYGVIVEEKLSIKVLDPAFISVAFAEMAARLKLCHTAATYTKFVNHNNLDLF